jgi:HTH-type transcriptional regulator / antitoxin HigA
MRTDLSSIRSEADYKNALVELERVWGPKAGRWKEIASTCWRRSSTPTRPSMIPSDPPDSIEAIRFRMEQRGLTRR